MQLHGDSIHWITYRCHQLLIFSAMRYQHSMMALTGFIVPADISRIVDGNISADQLHVSPF